MRRIATGCYLLAIASSAIALCSCSSSMMENSEYMPSAYAYNSSNYESRLPSQINPGEKVVVVDPRVHAWGAYGSDGSLIRGGMASAGSDYCSDLGHRCHTSVGTFRVYSLGSPECKSSKFPMPRGGAPMPYCMFFNGSQALHGSPDPEVVDANVSHGCVRMHVADAEWLRYNFVDIGTKVIVRPYE